MPLAPGTKLGPYEIQSPLGAGGMGEVYCAIDIRLGRTVAVKVLPTHLSAEHPEARQRFDREARVISSLNHPNICTLYDVGHEGGTDYLVMEYLEGETLANRLAKGPLTTEQILKYGIEICEGLEKAHRSRVVHRDLKPANIMLTKTGAKLMDFGLAKGMAPNSSDMLATVSHSAEPATIQGTVVGTFQYMSPEQVEGKEADARSDIFALGSVLYEMATRRRAFDGATTASVIAAVLERDPRPISAVQPMAPPALERVVKTCLAKDPDERFQTVHDLKLQLRWIADVASQAGVPTPIALRRKNREKFAWIIAGGLAILLIVFLCWAYFRPRPSNPGPVFAFIPPPPDTRLLAFGFGAGPIVVSPDGKELAFSAIDKEGKIKLWVRPLKAKEATAVLGTEDAASPFWSPDSHSLGFFAGGKLKTADLSSGSVQILGDASTWYYSAAWGPDGTILFSPAVSGPLNRIAATGKLSPVAPLKPDDFSNSNPAFLPDGKHFLYEAADRKNQHRVEMGSLDSGKTKLVLDNAYRPSYAAGFLLFVKGHSVFAQPFDPGSGKLSGIAVPLADASNYSVAAESVLAFQASRPEARLEWLDLSGNPQGKIGEVARYIAPKISPDGKQIATLVEDPQDPGNYDCWSLPAAGGFSSRMTFRPSRKFFCIWSPDGRYIAYGESAGKAAITRKPTDGSGTEETLLALGSDSKGAVAVDWSPDGRYLSYNFFSKDGLFELWILPLFGDKKPFQVLPPVRGNLYGGVFSPDGHWFAYFSDETGRPEVYIVPFSRSGGKYQISHAGGWSVQWSKKNQLFFLTTGNRLMVADLSLSAQSLQVKAVRPLFQMNLIDSTAPLFDVSADGQRFLTVSPAREESNSIGLLLNWPSLAKKR